MEDPYSKFTRLVENEKQKMTLESGARSDAEMDLLHDQMVTEREQEELRALAIEIRSETLAVAQFTADALLRHGVRKKEWFTEEPEFEQKGFGPLRRDVFRRRLTRYAFDGWSVGTLLFSPLGRTKDILLQEDGTMSLVSPTSYLSGQTKQFINRTPSAKRPLEFDLTHTAWDLRPIDTSIDNEFEMTLRKAFAYSDLDTLHHEKYEAAWAAVKVRDPEGRDLFPDELVQASNARLRDFSVIYRETDVDSIQEIDIDARLQLVLASALARHI